MIKATLRTAKITPGAVVDVVATAVPQPETAAPAAAGADMADAIPVTGEPTEPAGLHTDHDGPPPTQALAPRPPSAVALPMNEVDEDGFDQSDNKYPTLRIVAGSGKLSTMFNVGSLILGNTIDESEVIFRPPDPQAKTVINARFVPVVLHKFWRENLTKDETDAGMTPRIFKTPAEVEANGGVTVWIDDQPPTFKPTATCIMLIEQPEGVESSLFSMQLDGKVYCLAVYYAGNSAFKAFGLPIYNMGRTMLKLPILDAEGKPTKDARGYPASRKYYPKNYWTFRVTQTVKKKGGKDFTVFVPEVRMLLKSETGPEVRDFCDRFIASTPQEAASD